MKIPEIKWRPCLCGCGAMLMPDKRGRPRNWVRGHSFTFVNLEGYRFGRLVVVAHMGKPKGQRLWLCKCDCGGKTVAQGGNLKDGNTKSCGCLKLEIISTHGHSRPKTPTYTSWQMMYSRCLHKYATGYKYYGGRGIRLCARWLKFENFLEDMGIRPSLKHSIDRWPDKNGDYKPSNCRWATRMEQGSNMRSNVWLTLRGRTKTIMQWSRELGIKHRTIQDRHAKGWSAERVLQPL